MNATEKTIQDILAQDAENAREVDEYWADPDMIRDDELQDLISTLNSINFQIAELQRVKESLEPRVSGLLQHGDEGSKTYVCGKHKVTVKSGWIYTLNKDEYITMGARLPACFNPVTTRMSYDLNKSVIRDAEKYASSEELQLLATMISKKPAKLNVKITAGI